VNGAARGPDRQRVRRHVLLGGAGAAAAAMAPAALQAALKAGPAPSSCAPWPAWQRFAARFVSPDGRVIDPASARAHTVSEGQAYALFFALVAGDRSAFERLLRWTEDNLAQGDLVLRLPAWQWGRRDDGSWGVLDGNPAADADLWMAYALGEAGRLWGERRYAVLSALLLQRILREETADLPGLGPCLLPGANGFVREQGWRLNPSYAPPFLLRWAALHDADARWDAVRASALRVVAQSAPHGFVPDWALWRRSAGPQAGGGARRGSI